MENQVSMSTTGGVSELLIMETKVEEHVFAQAQGHSMDENNSEISSSTADIQLESGKTDDNMMTDLEVDLILEELVIPKLREGLQLGNSDAVGPFLAACKHFQTHLHKSRQFELGELNPHFHNDDKEEMVGQNCQPTSEDNEETKALIGSSISTNMHDETAKFVIFDQSDITDVLSKSKEIGKGGCGRVYKGELFGNTVAIKKLHSGNKSAEEEFLQEVGVLHGMHHPNLVKLLGACFQDPALVYEYVPNGSVDDHLKKHPSFLSWKIRTDIIFDTCLAIKYLHSRFVVHGDMKPANVLLDANFNSKVCDFGFSRFLPQGIDMHVYLATAPRGTLAYVDPEFVKTGILRPGSDLYSFGVTIMTLLTGRQSPGLKRKVRDANENSFRAMLDPTAGSWPFEVAKELRYWALQCCYHNDKSSELMEDMSIGLEYMLEDIESTTLSSSSLAGEGKPEVASSNAPTELDLGKDNNIHITEFWKHNKAAKTSSNGTSSEDELSESDIGTHASNFSDTSSSSRIVVFFHSEILVATDGFSESSKIGHGNVYRGFLCGTMVAIKKFVSKSRHREFFQEMGIAKLRHPNLVKLVGVCLEELATVHEFFSNGSLEDCLNKIPSLLTWRIRIRIIHGICSALIFLHSRRLVHGDLNPQNILLDANFNSKLCDFGLSRFLSGGTEEDAFLETNPKGTFEYIDLKFLETGILRPSSDLYSFGVIILKTVTGLPPLGLSRKVADADEKLFQDMLDTTAGQWPFDIAKEMAYWGLQCCYHNEKSKQLLEDILACLDDVLAEID